MLTATLVPTALVQAFAISYEWDDNASPDETMEDPIKSIEITKAPDKTEFTYSEVHEEDFIDKITEGMEFRVNMTNGDSYYYSYDELEYGHDFYSGELDVYFTIEDIDYNSYYDYYILSPGKHTVTYKFTLDWDGYYYYTVTQEINVTVPELTSIEITKATDNTTIEKYYDGYVWADDLMDGIEMLLTFDDGTTYNYSYDEDFEVPACFYENGIAEKYDYEDISLKIQEADEDGILNDLPLGETEITYQLLGCTATQKITVLENEYVLNPITKLELTKLPKRVFDREVDLSTPAVSNEDFEVLKDISVAYNMKGAELTIQRKNGEEVVLEFNYCIYDYYKGNTYGHYYCGTETDYYSITVSDLGNYKAVITMPYTDLSLEFTANNTSSGTGDTPATPGEVINPTTPSNPSSTVPTSSQGGTSSTSDTPVNSNTSANNTSNGAVATGNAAVSAILLSVLILAAGVMAVIGRKKQLF